MTQVHYFVIRFLKTSTRTKKYFKLQSPYYGDYDMCKDDMYRELASWRVRDNVEVDSFFIDTIFIDDVELKFNHVIKPF